VRAVFDPNVVISGLLSRDGSPAEALLAWQEGRFELIGSSLLLAELGRALAYPKLRARISERDADAALRWLSHGATIADDPTGEPPLHSEDPGDDHLIALAARERAALISGDRHLLSLAGRIPVYSPREFVALV